jgi:hypothetical protein
MAYTIQLTPAFKAYFRSAPLSRGERVRILAVLHSSLPTIPNAYRADPTNRVGPGSSCFWWHLIFAGDDGRVRTFRCAVDDSAATYGVLCIVYADVHP